MKSSIENRLLAVTNYAGMQDIVWLISQAMPIQARIGSDPDWMVARACMTPNEYAAWGNDGRPWAFLKGKQELAHGCIRAARKVVEEKCSAMKLQCDWSKIPQDREPVSVGRQHVAERIIKRSVRRMDTARDDQYGEAAAFSQLSHERTKFFDEFSDVLT